jgi:hypothetical protein
VKWESYAKPTWEPWDFVKNTIGMTDFESVKVVDFGEKARRGAVVMG